MACRFDTNAIGNVRRTPMGGVVLEGTLTRTGIFDYEGPDGKTIREYRSPAEVSNPKSLETLNGAAVTHLHPPVMVDTSNFEKYAKGNVERGSVKMVASEVKADLAINSGPVIAGIDSGELCELSCGYECDIDNTPGVTPEGLPYDRAQKNIVYNHVAIGPKDWARGGPAMKLRLDSKGNQCLNGVSNAPKRKPMALRLAKITLGKHSLRIDGVDYPLKTLAGRVQAGAAIRAVVERLKVDRADDKASRTDDAGGPDWDAIIAAVSDLMTLVHSAAASAGAAAESAEAVSDDADAVPTDDGVPPDMVDKPKADADPEADKAAKMDAAANKRAEIVAKARAFVPALVTSTRADGGKETFKSNVAIMREALTAARVDAKGLTDAEVPGAFAVIKPHETHASFKTLAGATGPQGRSDGAPVVTPQGAYRTKAAEAWKTGPQYAKRG